MTVNSPREFVTLKTVVLEPRGDAQPNEELATLIQSVADEWGEAHRRYLAKRQALHIH